jgi:two-component system cell cycle response regulator
LAARILIISADPASAAHLTAVLAAAGHIPLVPGSAAAHAVPDLVLCTLPQGVDALRMLAGLRDGAAPPGVPVLALAPLAHEGDSARLVAAGYDGYIALPLEPDSFVAELEAFLPPQAVEAPTLLLVDDDAVVLDILAEVLSHDGYRILTASSGAQALDLLARERVHVILCDQWMPGMSGTELMEQVHARHPQAVRLILSGQPESADIAQALASGIVDAFHAKPWTGAALLDGVKAAFLLQRERAPG